jgi:hypothetical protein
MSNSRESTCQTLVGNIFRLYPNNVFEIHWYSSTSRKNTRASFLPMFAEESQLEGIGKQV